MDAQTLRRKQERATAVALSVIDLMNQEDLDLYDKLTALEISQKLLGFEPSLELQATLESSEVLR